MNKLDRFRHSLYIWSKDEQIARSLCYRINDFAIRYQMRLSQHLRCSAIRKIRRLISHSPTTMLWTILGDVYYMTHKSRECYLKALDLNASNQEARYQLARLEFDFGGDAGSLCAYGMLDTLLSDPPEHINWLIYNLAEELYRYFGEPEKAHRVHKRGKKLEKYIEKIPKQDLLPECYGTDPLEISRPDLIDYE